ncbi:MAG TPA: universal stress protein [Micropepsaceae bacterium]|jgi:nucleotide-binding universal stress UspA family protein|nr:universal stress protein [Micropepsaceae bacterium]
MSDPAPTSAPSKRKFLVVVDQTEECKVALRFAARRAQHTGGIVTLLYVIPPADFQQWAGVERMMREEARGEAERALYEAAKTVNDIVGTMPELVIREGRPADEIPALLREDRAVSILVLATGTSKEGPGPLVSLISQPGANGYPIPVTVVPGTLTDEQVDALA